MWEDDPRLIEVLALLGAEKPNEFRMRLPERLTNIVGAVQSSGLSGWISQAGWAAVQRMAAAE